MNYEELLEMRNGNALGKETIPFGVLYRKMTDGKYVNAVDLRSDLNDSLVFADAFKSECEQNKKLKHKGQIHFELGKSEDGLLMANIEKGNYRSFESVLEENPAVVAGKDFMTNTVKELADITSYLHDQGICHVCYAPSNVFIRKGDNAVMLLFHGSAYKAMPDQTALYGEEVSSYVAPEVLEHGTIDERADVYSLGKFIEYLYKQSEIPLELKGVIKKATDEDAAKRYQTVTAMLTQMQARQQVRATVVTGVVAMAVVAFIFGLYFTMVPEREEIEFVTPAPKEIEDDLLDDGFDPTIELGLVQDTAAAHVDQQKMKAYEAKAEQIFRKNFTREAERMLSTIYTNEHMHTTEKNFMATSQSTLQELVKVQSKLGHDAGLSESRSQLIAGEIIDQVTARLKQQMNSNKNEEEE